jgi:hypothetical protein
MNSTVINKVKIPEVEISKEGVRLLGQLPPELSDALLEGFHQSLKKAAVVEHFRDFSFISNVLMRDPGTFEMLEVIYTGENLRGAIDEYFFESLSGQALRNRLLSIISQVGEIITVEVEKKGNIKVANLGSGPGRDTIEILTGNVHLANSVLVDCVDVNAKALEKGEELVKENGIAQNFNFINKDIFKLRYRSQIDLGLLIGILCGLEFRTCVAVLKKIKPYFREGGKLIAGNVLETMLEEDPFTSYLLKNIIGWKLVYKTPRELQEIFEKAGYEWKGIFYDEPTRFHAMGIGRVPFT